MSNSKVMLKTVWGQTLELDSVNGTTAWVWSSKKVNGETFHRFETFHTSKLFNLDGSPFKAEGN